ncbi:PREDICTED: uncharacterized protein LOC102850000 [Elephantulus edwardii]|uniref:uncharacterized protein LOC102850000 n=1 Tax=Elephantulus edwardii TaxID=28737 RepID=UPI0003F074DA|nr:PREDICTED: uncharacterized protein LOC102850000 [Elephantulus edwardii]
MKCLLLTLGLALVCGARAVIPAPVTEAVEVQKLQGIWHTLAMAASNLTLLETENGPLRLCLQKFLPTPEGNVEIVLFKWRRSLYAPVGTEQLELLPVSVFAPPLDLDQIKLFMMDTDYETMSVCMEDTTAPQRNLMCQLLGRTLNVKSWVLEKFRGQLKNLIQSTPILLDFIQRKGDRPPQSPQLFTREQTAGLKPPTFVFTAGGQYRQAGAASTPVSGSCKAEMLLLLCLGLSLARAASEPQPVSPPDFHADQIEGQWFSIKLGATDWSAIKEGGSYRCFMSTIKTLKNGDLKVTYFHREEGRCKKEFYIGKKTDRPGRYMFEYEGTNYVTFEKVTSDYALVVTENRSYKNGLVVLELYGRSRNVVQEGQMEFLELAARSSIPSENIVDLSAYRKPVLEGSSPTRGANPRSLSGDSHIEGRRQAWGLEAKALGLQKRHQEAERSEHEALDGHLDTAGESTAGKKGASREAGATLASTAAQTLPGLRVCSGPRVLRSRASVISTSIPTGEQGLQNQKPTDPPQGIGLHPSKRLVQGPC